MAPHESVTRACKLLELPQEVRIVIYRHLFNRSRSRMNLSIHNGEYWCGRENFNHWNQSAQIARTYTRINGEATRALYSRVSVHYVLYDDQIQYSLKAFLKLRYVRYLRVFSLGRVTSDSHGCNRGLEKGTEFFDNFPSLKTLNIDAPTCAIITKQRECLQELQLSTQFDHRLLKEQFEEALRCYRDSKGPLHCHKLLEVLEDNKRGFEVSVLVYFDLLDHISYP